MDRRPNEEDNGGNGESEELHQRPAYTTRHPPLVQPLTLSSFTEKAREKFAVADLADEWVALFQAIGTGGNLEHRHGGGAPHHRAMKMDVLDTVFLSPTGQPSVWYSTTSSMHIKARQLARVTPRAILESFQPKRKGLPCALVRKGFETAAVNAAQLQRLCVQMEHACLPSSPKQRDLDEDDQDRTDDVGVSGAGERDTVPAVFCVQTYVERAQNVSFLCLWRRVAMEKSSPRRRQRNDSTMANPDLPSPRFHAIDEIYVVQSDHHHPYTSESGASYPMDEIDAGLIDLQRLGTDEHDDAHTRKQLSHMGFDAEATLPLLLHVKLLTAEIVSRVNRPCGSSSRQVAGLACEFFLKRTSATNSSLQVVFAGLAGIEWQGRPASWEKLRDVDRMSRAISRICSIHTPMSGGDGAKRRREPPPATTVDANLLLAMFDELNPRFPSVQSPVVAENWWKHKSALLPPYVSPRYMGAEMPKQYRGGQFSPLLSPRQGDAINRLHIPLVNKELSPLAPRHPLSKKYADVERELWAKRDGDHAGNTPHRNLLLVSPRSPIALGSPTRASPRQRHSSLIKEELL